MSIEKAFDKDYLNPNLWEFSFIDNAEIQFLVKNITLPFISFTQQTQNTGIKYLEAYESESEFSITFLETKDMEVYDYLKEWQDTIFDKQRRVFKNGDHTKTGLFRIQQFTGNQFLANALKKVATYRTIKAFTFRNILLLGIDAIEWDYTGTEGKQISATFIADSVDESVQSITAVQGQL